LFYFFWSCIEIAIPEGCSGAGGGGLGAGGSVCFSLIASPNQIFLNFNLTIQLKSQTNLIKYPALHINAS
jgi:hypothetical protein